MFGIGMTELMVIFVIGLLVLGPKRLPELARNLGRGLAEFRRASLDIRKEFMDVADEARIAPEHLEAMATDRNDPGQDMPPQAGMDLDDGAHADEANGAHADDANDTHSDAADGDSNAAKDVSHADAGDEAIASRARDGAVKDDLPPHG